MSLELFLGIWGAGLATALAFIEIRRWMLDRADLDVVAELGVEPFDQWGDGPEVARVRVTNKGRRPTSVVEVWLETSTGRQVILPSDRPVLLGEGASHVTGQYTEDLAEADVESLVSDVVFAWARDGVGRLFKSDRFPFRRPVR